MPDPSDSAIRELARNILARREYWAVEQIQEPAWIDWLRRFESWFKALRVNSPILYWTFLAAIVIVVLASIVQIIWTLRAALRAQAPPARPVFSAKPPDLAADARQLAASGRFLDAAHRLMIATFGLLAERAVIELRPDHSNRWIRTALRGSSLAQALAIEIGALVEQTERRWFGKRTDEPDIYQHWSSIYQRLVSSVE